MGASPGRTLRNSLFHTVSLMSAWWRPGLKEMGLNTPSKGRACWSSALGARVCGDDHLHTTLPFHVTLLAWQPCALPSRPSHPYTIFANLPPPLCYFCSLCDLLLFWYPQ